MTWAISARHGTPIESQRARSEHTFTSTLLLTLPEHGSYIRPDISSGLLAPPARVYDRDVSTCDVIHRDIVPPAASALEPAAFRLPDPAMIAARQAAARRAVGHSVTSHESARWSSSRRWFRLF